MEKTYNSNIEDKLMGLFDEILKIDDKDIKDIPEDSLMAVFKSAVHPQENDLINTLLEDFRENNFTKKEITIMRQEMETMMRMIVDTSLANGLSQVKQRLIQMIMDFISSVIDKAATQYGIYDCVIYWEKLDENAQIPKYAEDGARGMDVFTIEEVVLAPHSHSNFIRTGLSAALPENWGLDVMAKSGIAAKTTARISNSVGVVDSSYTDEIQVIMDNLSDYPVVFKQGQKFAQLLLKPIYRSLNKEATKPVKEIVGDRDRGGGFGSGGLF